jgi:hypothetical protein
MEPDLVSSGVEEQAKHLSAIASLSEHHHLPADKVAEVYERELANLMQDALITIYLPIFVTRRVDELLRRLSTAAARAPEKRFPELSH